MIPFYRAIGHEEVLIGGNTRPWVVIVENGHQVEPYVVKIYGKDFDYYNPKLAEVICSVLAPKLGLRVPGFAFVTLDKAFHDELSPELQKQLKNKDTRINFSTRLIEQNYKYEQVLQRSSLTHYDLDSIFAFDNLVFNVDRTVGKPNVLFSGDKCYLIDHEKTFPFTEGNLDSAVNYGWKYPAERHAFYNYLKRSRKDTKGKFFKDFHSKLKKVDLNILDKYVDYLGTLYVPVHNWERIREFLFERQKYADKFIENIRRVIT